jgi:hypothetical protein
LICKILIRCVWGGGVVYNSDHLIMATLPFTDLGRGGDIYLVVG